MTMTPRVDTYLNFQGQSEEAMNFYKEIFNPDGDMFMLKFKDTPMAATLPADEVDKVMHASLEIIGGHKLLATDMLKSMGHEIKIGNNITISLNFGTREELDKYYAHLSVGSTENAEPHQEPWGYWGVCLDRYGIRWMFNVQES